MARLTRAESARRTRERLLDAAEEVFADEGFGAASLDRVAERAGFTRGAVYKNFDGKPELFLAVLDRWLERQVADFAAMEGRTPAALLDELADGEGNRFADRRHFLLLGEVRLYALRHPEVLPRLADLDRRTVDWYAEVVLAVAAAAGVAPPEDPRRLALAVLALEHGVATLAHTDPSVPQDAFVALLRDMVALSARARGVAEGRGADGPLTG